VENQWERGTRTFLQRKEEGGQIFTTRKIRTMEREKDLGQGGNLLSWRADIEETVVEKLSENTKG